MKKPQPGEGEGLAAMARWSLSAGAAGRYERARRSLELQQSTRREKALRRGIDKAVEILRGKQAERDGRFP